MLSVIPQAAAVSQVQLSVCKLMIAELLLCNFGYLLEPNYSSELECPAIPITQKITAFDTEIS